MFQMYSKTKRKNFIYEIFSQKKLYFWEKKAKPNTIAKSDCDRFIFIDDTFTNLDDLQPSLKIEEDPHFSDFDGGICEIHPDSELEFGEEVFLTQNKLWYFEFWHWRIG